MARQAHRSGITVLTDVETEQVSGGYIGAGAGASPALGTGGSSAGGHAANAQIIRDGVPAAAVKTIAWSYNDN